MALDPSSPPICPGHVLEESPCCGSFHPPTAGLAPPTLTPSPPPLLFSDAAMAHAPPPPTHRYLTLHNATVHIIRSSNKSNMIDEKLKKWPD